MDNHYLFQNIQVKVQRSRLTIQKMQNPVGGSSTNSNPVNMSRDPLQAQENKPVRPPPALHADLKPRPAAPLPSQSGQQRVAAATSAPTAELHSKPVRPLPTASVSQVCDCMF